MPGLILWLGFDFKEGDLLVPMYYYTCTQQESRERAERALSLSKEETPENKKRAESERSELSLSTTSTIIKCKEDKPAHNKRVEL